MELAFSSIDELDNELHRTIRSDVWMGGAYAELMYFLGCLTCTNYWQAPFEIWDPEVRRFIKSKVPGASWILESQNFHSFAVLLFRNEYRRSKLGKRYPIWDETRDETRVRFVLEHPNLTIDELAVQFKTTVKQVQRNTTLMLAKREYTRLQNQ